MNPIPYPEEVSRTVLSYTGHKTYIRLSVYSTEGEFSLWSTMLTGIQCLLRH